jgi:uncharacterized repeat protein (TIGR01451 family)
MGEMNAMLKHYRALAIGVSCFFASQPAWAACSAANQYNFNFSSQAATTLAYGSNYNYTATSTALGTQAFNVAFSQFNLTSTTVGGEVRPNLSASHNGGGTAIALVVGGVLPSRTATITANTRVMVTTFTFTPAVRDVSLVMHDVDFGADQFRDWIHIIGRNGATTYVPRLTTPFGQINGTGPFTNASSSLKLGPQATSPAAAIDQAVGTGTSGNNSTTGNLDLSFPEPVTSVQIRYGNFPLTGTETTTGQQAFAISTVSWCPMPVVTMTKTSAPFSDPQNGTTNPKLIPGGDLIYTLTVNNSNSSPVDASTLVLTDPLPAAVTFYNGDIDDAGPLTTNYEFNAGASTLTFGAANLTYSNNGGSTYAYPPAAGYDPAVNAIRLAPQGTMAANSNFSLKFRARIK